MPRYTIGKQVSATIPESVYNEILTRAGKRVPLSMAVRDILVEWYEALPEKAENRETPV